MTKYRKHTKIAEQEQEQQEQEQQFSNFLDRSRYSHGQKTGSCLLSAKGSMFIFNLKDMRICGSCCDHFWHEN